MSAAFRRWAGPAAGVLLLCIAASPLGAGGSAELVAAGNEELASGAIAQATARYEEARQASPDSPVPLFNLGVALYRQGNFPAALTAFQEVHPRAPALAAKVHYNQGNALARLGQEQEESDPQAALDLYRAGLAAYRRALDIEPGFTQAAVNLEVVRSWVDRLLQRAAAQAAGQGQPRAAEVPGQQGQQAPGGSDPGEAEEEPAPQEPAPQPAPQVEDGGPRTPLEETAYAILREEQLRREAEARQRQEANADGKPTW